MDQQGSRSFGEALKLAIRHARTNQAAVARDLHVDPGQVSRWVNGKALPHVRTVEALERILGAELSESFSLASPHYELYVAAAVSGLSASALVRQHEAVGRVIEVVKQHTNSLYWPGEGVTSTAQLRAADIATERDLRAMSHCVAFLYLQFEEVSYPSSALVELGLALGRRLKTTVISQDGLRLPYMLDGFGAVAASIPFLPKARIYRVASVDDACALVQRNGRELLGLT